MPLKMRPTGLGHGVYKDNVDYGVFCGEWCIGRIYETRTGPEILRWFWALHAPSKPGTTHRQPRGDAGRGQGRVRGELEAVEGVGGVGRGPKSAAVGWLACFAPHTFSPASPRGFFFVRVPPTLGAGLLKSSHCPSP